MLEVDGTLVGWVSGRWQPWCNHHVEVCEHARRFLAQHAGVSSQDAYLAVGVSILPKSYHNPFSYEQRARWISESSENFVPFRLSTRSVYARREILNNVGNIPMYTREKKWYYLTRFIGLLAIYAKRSGEAATNVRELWYAGKFDELAARVPSYVVKDMEELLQDDGYVQRLLASRNKVGKLGFLTPVLLQSLARGRGSVKIGPMEGRGGDKQTKK